MDRPRLTRCRMTDRFHNPCTGEAIDPEAAVLICARHAGLVMALIREHTTVSTKAA